MEEKITRKEFLKSLAGLGVAAIGAGAILQSCGGGSKEDTGADKASNFSCNDLTGLTQAEVQTRQNMKYVDKTPYDEKRCNNCNFWVPPQAGKDCGGCTVVKGPIHPQGYCITWVPKA